MSDLLAARSQMAMSLAFHILFAVAGMAMPLLMVLAELRHQRTGDPAALELAKRWAKGTAILFAVGAVSGTVLSFELGLLWPQFMRHAGPLVGMPFSLEGFAFFLEAIFLGLYLYGWDHLRPRVHLACGLGVALCGLLSAIFVVAVNAWMNEPSGFEYVDGAFVNIRPWEAMFNGAFFSQALHMALAAYASIAVAVMGIHAWALRREPDSALHRTAFRLALGLALVAVPAQIVSGDHSAKHIARDQPVKLAAAEALFETQTRAPLALGGIADSSSAQLRGAIELPGMLSLIAFSDPDAEVTGLDSVPRELWPPVNIVHFAFDLMVGCGLAMLAVVGFGGLWWVDARLRGRPPPWARPRYLIFALLAGPLGFIALEAGWVVTEVGRQPWVIQGYMKTSEAVTPMPGLVAPFLVFSALYLFLGVVVIVLLKNHVLAATPGAERAAEETSA
ncbi:cytochrome ubiquinol oxidase subunit I [Enhygromyxa salina]|uniref:cytochrome ubiquinol oxidase subunit I n=1 Tax=Enhygromyxa salina TaxID=215803 RepID=UPI002158CA4A|nr:cytochrome ubiquinol oxidase subunit I [Enhygromyxa salina]